jgi:polyhydroxybutyrate depolymerase
MDMHRFRMRIYINIVCILLFIVVNMVQAQESDPKKKIFKIDNRERIYYLYISDNLQDNAPLVFVLHGYGGSAREIIDFAHMNTLADTFGFAVCYPQGVLGNDNKNSWNAGYSNPDVDDVKFLAALARHLQTAYKLSSKNTFATGMSNGADMCYVLACRCPDVFSAIAPVAGCMMESTYSTCNPTKPLPVFEIHGTDDDITLWNGDAEYSVAYGGYLGVRETFDFWINMNNCSLLERNILPDMNKKDSTYIVFEKFGKGIQNNEVWLYILVGGKHDWPGSWGNMDIVAAEEIWNFFQKFVK